jgi:hypothetical protein
VERNSFTSVFKKLPAACCIALLFIVLCEAAINRFDYYFYKPDYQNLRIAIKNSVSQKRTCDFDVIALGDCYLTVGYIPSLLKEKTGLSGFNFSTNQKCTVLSAYAMLNNYLGTCANKPQYILLAFIPSSIELTKESIIEAMPLYSLSFYDIRRGCRQILIREFGLEVGLRLLLPSLNYQERIKDFLSQRSLYSKRTIEQVDSFIESVNTENGYFPYRVDDRYNGWETENQENQKPFVASSLFLRYFTKMLDLARMHGIKVVYILPALPPDILALYKKSERIEKNLIFLENLQKDYPNLLIADPQHLITEREMFVDKIHLNGKGARILTTFIADRIKHIETNGQLTNAASTSPAK